MIAKITQADAIQPDIHGPAGACKTRIPKLEIRNPVGMPGRWNVGQTSGLPVPGDSVSLDFFNRLAEQARTGRPELCPTYWRRRASLSGRPLPGCKPALPNRCGAWTKSGFQSSLRGLVHWQRRRRGEDVAPMETGSTNPGLRNWKGWNGRPARLVGPLARRNGHPRRHSWVARFCSRLPYPARFCFVWFRAVRG